MNRLEFLRPILHGARFEGGSIPLELLRDLAVLEEIVIEVAKSEFLRSNPQRVRAPRGFAERVELRLTGVGEGSAVVELALVIQSAMLPGLEPEQVYLTRARDAIVEAIAAAGEGRSVTNHLPEKTLSYFDRFGRSLRDGEWIEFRRSADNSSVRFDREIRRSLVLASPTARELTEETTVRGRVPEADQDVGTFQLMLSDGRKIKAPIDEPHRDVILEAFRGWREGQSVEVRGIGRLDRNARLLSIDSVHDVNWIDLLDVPARLQEIAALTDGWLDGKGLGPERDQLDWLARWFAAHLPAELPLPYLYPTPEGGVQAEWSIGTTEISLEIDLSNKRAIWHRLDLASGIDEHREIDLTDLAAAELVTDGIASALASVP